MILLVDLIALDHRSSDFENDSLKSAANRKPLAIEVEVDRPLCHTEEQDLLGDIEGQEVSPELVGRALVEVDLLRLDLGPLQHVLRLEGVGEGNKGTRLHHRHPQK